MEVKTRIHFYVEDRGLIAEAMLYPVPKEYEYVTGRKFTPWLYLHRVWTKARRRHEGHGSRLLDRVQSFSRDTGTSIVLRVRPFNAKGLTIEKLVRLYERHGFERIEKPCPNGPVLMVLEAV